MNWKAGEHLLPIASGFIILTWVLSFPFYGSLAYNLLDARGVWGTHSFALGLAAGFFVSAMPKYIPFPSVVAAPVAAGLCWLAVMAPHPALSAALMFICGLAASIPMLTWAGDLGGMEKPVAPFITSLVLSSIWCAVTYLPWQNPRAHYLMAGIVSLLFIAAPWGLKVKTPVKTDRPLPWPRLKPLLLFIVVTSWSGGLLHRAFMPALADWKGIAWLSFWPYIAALIPAGILARRRYEPLAALSLSTLGLALLALALENPALNTATKLAGLTGTLAGAAFADAFIWLSLIYFVYRGYPKSLGFGLGVNVFVILLVGMAADLLHLGSPVKLHLAALSGAALLFILLPVILPRLPLSSPGIHINGRDIEPKDDGNLPDPIAGQESGEKFTAAEKRVLELLLEGKKNKEIAEELFISLNTVKFHVRNILRKSDCSSRRELFKKMPERREDLSVPESLTEEI